jgi:hypothetical protein
LKFTVLIMLCVRHRRSGGGIAGRPNAGLAAWIKYVLAIEAGNREDRLIENDLSNLRSPRRV